MIINRKNKNYLFLEQKYLNILVEKGYKITKRILSIDNHKYNTDYLLSDFKIFKDYRDNNFFYSTMVDMVDSDREDAITTNNKDISIAKLKTDYDSIAKYKKRYYDFKKAFHSIVNHDKVKKVSMIDTTFNIIDNESLNNQIDCFIDTLTNKVVFVYVKHVNSNSNNYNYQPSYNMLWNRIEECNNFIYNGRVREEELSLFIGYNLDKFYNEITNKVDKPNKVDKSNKDYIRYRACYMNHELEEYLNSDRVEFKII